MNSQDPLSQNHPTHIELLQRMSKAVDGASAPAVADAGALITINAMRQQHATRAEAEQAWDQLAARMKEQLMSSYDASGRRRNVFPFEQQLVVRRLDLRHMKYRKG